MSRWLIVLFVIAAVGLLWFRQRERRTAELHRRDDARFQRDSARVAAQQPLAAPSDPPAGAEAARGVGADDPGSGARPLKEAVEAATGRDYLEATERLQEESAELAAARQAAEQAARTLAQEADAALAAVQAAAATQGGAVPGDGTPDCPAGYPVKGDLTTRRFVETGQPDYRRLTPGVCFQNVAAAEAAGFLAMGAGAADDVSVLDGRAAGIVTGAALLAREPGADVVAEAIEAASSESAPPGAVRGDGGRECPPAYPIKGNQTSMLYHEPNSRSYTVTIPEFCFSTVEAAEAAGFSAPRR